MSDQNLMKPTAETGLKRALDDFQDSAEDHLPQKIGEDVVKSEDEETKSADPAADDEEDDEEEGVKVLPAYFPAIQGCRSVESYSFMNRIEEGTFGVVFRAQDKQTGEVVALKRLKMEHEREGFPITSLREISTLLKAKHENIVRVREVVMGGNLDSIYLVMDFVEHDLKSLMDVMKKPFSLGEIKTLMIQLCRAIAHLHNNWILHRDLKTSNLLLSHKGILKVGDFGLAREYGSPLKTYTTLVVTLWYRAPELLLETKRYSYAVDNWSVGCIFGELARMKPMFMGKSEVEQVNIIFQELGTPNDKIWPGFSELPIAKKVKFKEHPYNNIKSLVGKRLGDKGVELINRFLFYSPSKRITCEDALEHDFFKESPYPVDPSMFATWPAKSEKGVRKVQSPKAPTGGKKLKPNDIEELYLPESKSDAPGGFHMNAESSKKMFNLKF